ncbi:MAG: aspartate carbamoyltransferase catalytic subunit, partial [Sphingomonas sp.]
MAASFPHRHLLGVEGLSASDILTILDEAEHWVAFNRRPRKADDRLSGLTQINAFFENSTRTLFSFEIAGKRLGAQVASFHPAASSVRKGESLIDTALTLNAMRP